MKSRPIINYEQQCSKCERWKSIKLFYKDNHLKNGISSQCMDCHSLKRKKQRETGYIKHYHMYRHYGLTKEKYEEMLKEQKGCCLLCNRTKSEVFSRNTNLVVDHCHTTGQVRALLCSRCNIIVGMIEKQYDGNFMPLMNFLIKHSYAQSYKNIKKSNKL